MDPRGVVEVPEQQHKSKREWSIGKVRAETEPENSLLQAWVWKLSWKMQTALMTGLRGPDAGGTTEIKAWVRWIRSVTVNNASPNEKFMRDENRLSFQEIETQLDKLPVHYYSHLMHALHIIYAGHFDPAICTEAHQAYNDLCHFLHLEPEDTDTMIERLKDNR